MHLKVRKIAVLGAGSWGTALAHHLRRANYEVCLWGRDEGVLKSISEERENPKYLSGESLAAGIRVSTCLVEAVAGAELLVIALPSSAVRAEISAVKAHVPKGLLIVSAVKGLENATLKRMSVVIEEELGKENPVSVLSGPSFAREVVRGKPTAVTLACLDESVAQQIAEVFHYDSFRVYTSTDVIGVEFGGVFKNIIAIAAGVVDGLQMGNNARAALITRGLSEMQRLVVALGGSALTVGGLSGLGDLLLTATGDLSRNRQVGIRLGQGEQLEDILGSLGQVAEGVQSASKVLALAKRHNVPVPITEEVVKLLTKQCSIKDSVNALLSRTRAGEISFLEGFRFKFY
ncbi:MAG: NAD(P)-dependent glycerol-3-phosphate dehydrogenase [Deltaproteobacteria bacterium]|nr:NAD(P)-dependent glycerol-3-phosphate dehydrogenase [Deltaproteobacteria bacterium]